jgi:hypothetical protein
VLPTNHERAVRRLRRDDLSIPTRKLAISLNWSSSIQWGEDGR